MLFANLRFIKAINKMAKVKSMLNNIGVIKIYSHMGTTLHKRLRYFEIFKILLKTLNLFITKIAKLSSQFSSRLVENSLKNIKVPV